MTLIPFTVLTAVLLNNSAHERGKLVLASCQADAEQAVSMLDLRVQEMNSIAYQLQTSDKLSRYLMQEAGSDARQGIDEMAGFCDGNLFVDLIGIYFCGDNRLYTTNGMMRPDVYAEQLGDSESMRQEFLHELNERTSAGWMVCENAYLYVTPLPIGSVRPNRVVLFQIDQETVRQALDSLIRGEDKLILLRSHAGTPLYVTDGLNAEMLEAVLQDLKRVPSRLRWNGVRYRLLQTSKNVQRLLEITVLVPERYLSIALGEMGAALMLDILLLAVCMAASYAFAREAFKPVEQLGSMVGGAESWDDIHSGVQNAMRLSEDYSEQLARQRLLLRETCLMRLLYGRSEMLPLDQLSEQFGGENLLVACVRALDQHGANANAPVAQRLMERITLENIRGCTAVEVLQEDVIVLVLAVGPEDDRETAIERVRETFADVSNGSTCLMRVGIGRVARSISDVRTAYLQALAALRSLCTQPPVPEGFQILWFDRVLPPASNLPDITEKEIYLKLALEQGDSQLANNTLDDIFRVVNAAPKALAHHLGYQLIGYLEPTIRELCDPCTRPVYYEEMVQMINASRMDQLQRALGEVVGTLTREIRERAVHREDDMKMQVLACVEKNYADYTFSLDFLSGQFGFSCYYWSRYFKENVGQNFSDYLWMLRLKRAKELLRTSMRVSEVVERVGYIDMRSFNRKFKNSVGVTPAQYKKMFQDGVYPEEEEE